MRPFRIWTIPAEGLWEVFTNKPTDRWPLWFFICGIEKMRNDEWRIRNFFVPLLKSYDMRRSDRAMDAAFAFEVFDKAPYITVSFTRPDGSPYGVPLSLVWTDEHTPWKSSCSHKAIIIFTWSSHYLVTKTTCFGQEKGIYSHEKSHFIYSKTTCFGHMKAYEGKNFAFIRASHWLLIPYTIYEGKLNFKQNFCTFLSWRYIYKKGAKQYPTPLT